MLMRPSMPALLFALIHPSAWNSNSANFAFWAFSEVRECAQVYSICSSVFTPQFAGGLRGEGRSVYSSPTVLFNSVWVRPVAPERSAPERSAAKRDAPKRDASKRDAYERFAPSRNAFERSAPESFAPKRFASEKSASDRL